jgi:aminoglycoside phosphotransferase
VDGESPNDIALPARLRERLSGYSFSAVTLGESGAAVWRCTRGDGPPLYHKRASLAAALELDEEGARLRWMLSRGAPVSPVRDYCRTSDSEFLLVEEAPGLPACDRTWTAAIPASFAKTSSTTSTLDANRPISSRSTHGDFCPLTNPDADKLRFYRLLDDLF